ncbi:MAG: alkaline phosphatase family protein [Alistipes sp.]|nr:alkaline phosphatase family protein [Alistipes sp.]
MKNLKIYTLLFILSSAFFAAKANTQVAPRLLVNIVVSSMHADDLDKYSANFSSGGFRRLMNNGAWFTNASYDYMQTTTPVSLATISTGAMPSVHGVVADRWFDYVGNKQVMLIDDKKEQSVNYSGGSGGYSPRNLTAQTLSEVVAQSNSKSHVATIAIEPLSAIVMAGKAGDVYWMETLQTAWTTSSYYTKELPAWIADYNRNEVNQTHMIKRWTPLLAYDDYRNCQVSCIEDLKSNNNKRIDFIGVDETSAKTRISDDYDQMCFTPAGNSALLSFAKQVITKNEMGKDEVIDVLNIVLDTPRKISSRFGPESVEYEDMLYRLDRDLEDFISYIMTQVIDPQHIVISLTSDHGTSPSYNSPGMEQERFNIRQAEVITNAFIGAQHGNGEWILGCIDNAIYLNHNLIYEKGLSITEMQNDVAMFVMQLRGVSHAMSAEAMRGSYFGSGYGRKIQNGFYPRRSGDVIINLMPGWIEENDKERSSSGSMYRYDTQVPLIIFGGGVTRGKVADKVDITSLATTLSHIIGVSTPSAAEGEMLKIE